MSTSTPGGALVEIDPWRYRGGNFTSVQKTLLSRASIARMHELMETLARELDELVAADLRLPAAERHGVTLFVGLRPWEFSEFTKMRREPREKFV